MGETGLCQIAYLLFKIQQHLLENNTIKRQHFFLTEQMHKHANELQNGLHHDHLEPQSLTAVQNCAK